LAFATIGPEWWHGGFITGGFAAVDRWAGYPHPGRDGSGIAGTPGGFHGRSWGRSSWGAERAPGWGRHWQTARANGSHGWHGGGGGWRGGGSGWHEARGSGGFAGGHRR
jgi:hypothetical protein